MLQGVRSFFQRIPKYVLLLGIIVLVGIFFRAYNFHDWLRFSPDEARDATYISDAILGKANLPALGPQAGNTNFYLGPLYYQMEYVSARIFGNAPDKLAYPDLLFSILAIPMLFFFLRRYFSLEVSLALDALFSFSYFAISTSRFASNPNSIPFFILVFLYGLLVLMEKEHTKKYLFAILVGISMGVGIQLHALLFLILPAVALGVLGFLMYEKNIVWRDVFLVLFFFLVVNIEQLNYELHTNGANISHLFKGAQSESNIGATVLASNITTLVACQIQANIHIVMAPIDFENCGSIFNVRRAAEKEWILSGAGKFINGGLFTLEMLFCVLFSIGGYVLARRCLKKEQNEEKRKFLGLFLFYNLVSLLVMIPVTSQLSVHYFNILIFVPFILLGLWADLLLESERAWKEKVFIFGLIVLLGMNFLFLIQKARIYENKGMSNVDESILGEIIPMVDYLIAESEWSDRVYIDGSKFYLKRFLKPFDYLSRKQGVQMIRPANDRSFDVGTKFFYIDGTKKDTKRDSDVINGDKILTKKRFQQITLYTMVKQ